MHLCICLIYISGGFWGGVVQITAELVCEKPGIKLMRIKIK